MCWKIAWGIANINYNLTLIHQISIYWENKETYYRKTHSSHCNEIVHN